VRISGLTTIAGVIGDPIGHSLSPALHNAAFAALGLDWAYLAFPVAPQDVRAALTGAVALGVRGLSVTMPHKVAAAKSADQRTPAVELLGAANTIVVRSGMSVAHSTDGAGLLADLRDGAGFEPSGRRCVVLGAGGAARATVLALATAGAASVVVVNRTAARAELAARLAGPSGRVGTVDDVADAELVVNATPVGMEPTRGHGPSAPRPGGAEDLSSLGSRLAAGQLAVDLVYAPRETPFLAAASAQGAGTRNGLGMLVGQAAVAFQLWTGEQAPLEQMWAAVEEATPPSA